MKQLLNLLAFSAMLTGFSTLSAANTALVTVTFNILAEDDIAFSGNPGIFNLTPGNSPVTDNSTTYSVTTNQNNQRISALINSALPTGVTLAVDLTAPAGATSLGLVNLTTVSANLVTGITDVDQSGLLVTYSMSASPSAAIGGPFNRTITYTLSS